MLDSIRIAFLSEHASPLSLLGGVDAGGQNVYVDEVSRNLGTLGHTVDVFTRRDNPDVPDIVQWSPGVRIVHIAAGPPEFIPKDDVWPLMPAFRDGIAAFMLRNARTYDVIHSNFWMSGWVAAQLKPLLRVPVIHIFHAMGLTKRRHQGSSDTSPGERMTVEREVIARVDALIAQCPAEEHELIDDYAAEAGKVALIPSAVNVDTYRPIQQAEARHALGINPDVPLVVYVGRMLPRKDVRNVIRAVALMVEREDVPVELLLVGGESAEPDPVLTPEIGVLRSLARDLGIPDRVRFTGKRQPDVLCYYYSAADVVVTTPWYEPFGLTPLEAMACGRPVVGSAVGGITFTIADGETGYLVPPRDPEALADRLRFLLIHRDMCRLMGGRARARIEEEFTWVRAARNTTALYRQVLGAQEIESHAVSTACGGGS